jgi:uracil-DNA glycosylase family 4
MRSPEARQAMRQQYARGLRDPKAIVARAREWTRQLVAAGEAKSQRMTAEERYRGHIVIAQRITGGQGKHPVGFGEEELKEILDRIGENYSGEYVFVDLIVTRIEHRRTERNFPLYNIGVEGDESYIAAGIVSHNCRPPGNRDPRSDEIEACKQFLDRQIEIINPKVIVTLGRFSMARYFPDAKITKIHGKPKRIGNRIYYPVFHPAAALHQPRWRSAVEEDFRKIPQLLKEIERIAEEPEKAEQLTLF